MKLLIITAIVAFESDIKKMLQQANVNTYSFKEVLPIKKRRNVNYGVSLLKQND